MATKKRMTIQEIDWENHLRRLGKGFVNRWQERRSLHQRRKKQLSKAYIGQIKV